MSNLARTNTSVQVEMLFPIRELSSRTGVNSVTLRAWERRYGLLTPLRTEKGHRLYSEQDVERVQVILEWINKGVAVSKVRGLLEQSIPPDIIDISSEWHVLHNSLLVALGLFNEDKIDQLYHQVSSQYPADVYIKFWLVPVLKTLRGEANSDAMYAFLTACLIARISSRVVSQEKGKGHKVLLTSSNNEDRIWVWLQAVWCLDSNYHVTVLDNLPSFDLIPLVIEKFKPDCYLGHFDKGWASKKDLLLAKLNQTRIPIVLSGAGIWLELKQHNNISNRIKIFADPFAAVEYCLQERKA